MKQRDIELDDSYEHELVNDFSLRWLPGILNV